MKGKGRYLIGSMVLVLIGIILLMVACETGALFSDVPVPEDFPMDNTQIQHQENPGSQKDMTESPSQENEDEENSDEGKNKLYKGKPYSQTLVGEDTINILFIGVDKQNDLYDSIGIVNIDKSNKTVKLIMIPRDTYIEYSDDIVSKLEKLNLANEPGIYKINCAHFIGGKMDYSGRFPSGKISFLADVIEEKFGVKVDDYVKINTRGFRDLVDYLGGVDIQVPYDMFYEDPSQDLYINLEKGKKHLNGAEAEGFVRFRQGVKKDGTPFEIGDVGRKKNQLTFLKELIKQKGTIKNIGRIPGILELLGKNVEHSVGLSDVLKTYTGIAANIVADKYEIETVNIDSEKMIRIKGSSYLVVN